MALHHSPKIVTNGLILCLDAANPKSYPGSGTTWSDLSGNGNNGTLTNGPTFDSANLGSISFDGVDDYVEITDSTTMRMTSGGTILAWIYPLSLGGGSNARIISKGDSGSSADYHLFIGGTNQLAFRAGGSSLTLSPNNAITLNKWNFITVVFNNTGRFLSIDGVVVNSSSESTTTLPPNTAGVVRIGQISNDTTRTFDGRISNIIQYSKAFTPQEILQNYNALKGRFGL